MIDQISGWLSSIWEKRRSQGIALVQKIGKSLPLWLPGKPVQMAVGYLAAITALLTLLLIYIQFLAPVIFECTMRLIPSGRQAVHISDSSQLIALQHEIASQTDTYRQKLQRFSSASPYLVINSTKNTFQLYKGDKLIREGICSTGSYVKLEQDDQNHWVFRTPKGMFKIRGKNKYPVWKKPDWAFVEEGKAVPSPNHPSRFEYGVLGDYSLALGDGYLIHGTLYQRLLGMPVTHGCVRLGDDDLESVFRTLNIGDRVLIY